MSAAREAVARTLYSQDTKGLIGTSWIEMSDGAKVPWLRRADAALAALRPFIAAEIRAWAVSAPRGRSAYADADVIASRICGGDQ